MTSDDDTLVSDQASEEELIMAKRIDVSGLSIYYGDFLAVDIDGHELGFGRSDHCGKRKKLTTKDTKHTKVGKNETRIGLIHFVCFVVLVLNQTSSLASAGLAVFLASG